MRTAHVDASDSELVRFIEDWVDLLASGDFAAASRFLHPPDEAALSEEWTAENLELYIANYGSWDPLDDGRRMHVTPIDGASGDLVPVREVSRYDDRPPRIDFDLPLNGEWSDLTALFDLVQVDDARWAFVLYDLRVL
jgi:hypothetical protein